MQKFKVGDVVKYIKRKHRCWKYGEEHIIRKAEYNGKGEFQYSTNHGAWFDDDDFELVRPADLESFAQLDKDLGYDCEDEEL